MKKKINKLKMSDFTKVPDYIKIPYYPAKGDAHTPTPWKKSWQNDMWIMDSQGNSVLRMAHGKFAANRDFILRACNAHDEFIRLLNDAQKTIDVLAEDSSEAGYAHRAENAAALSMEIRTALKKAEGR